MALLPTVISLVVVILAQSAATSRAYAMKYADRFDENVDLVGLGLANLGAGITGTFVVNGSPTKTEMVDSAGGRTQVAQLTAAAVVVVVLLFLTGPLAYMPNAVLASVVFLIGAPADRLPRDDRHLPAPPGRVRRRRRHRGGRRRRRRGAGDHPRDGPLDRRAHLPQLPAVRHAASSTSDGTPGTTSRSRTGARGAARASWSTASARASTTRTRTRFTEEIMGIVETPIRRCAGSSLSGSAIADIDYSGADSLRQVQEELARTGVTFAVGDLSPKVRDAARRVRPDGADRRRPSSPRRRDARGGLRASADAGAAEAPTRSGSGPGQG